MPEHAAFRLFGNKNLTEESLPDKSLGQSALPSGWGFCFVGKMHLLKLVDFRSNPVNVCAGLLVEHFPAFHVQKGGHA